MKLFRGTASALVIRELPGPDGVDTSKRIMHGQIVEAHGASFDGAWLYVQAPAGSGWASASYLEEAPTAVAEPIWAPPPSGLAGIRATFGEPGTFFCSAGRVSLKEPLIVAWDRTKTVSAFACHVFVAAPMQTAFDEVHRRGYWDLLEDFGGCYNVRPARGLAKKSTHSWGIAVDLATASNPLGAKPKMDRRVVAIFEDIGFTWGGRWTRPDGMHFQWATGY